MKIVYLLTMGKIRELCSDSHKKLDHRQKRIGK